MQTKRLIALVLSCLLLISCQTIHVEENTTDESRTNDVAVKNQTEDITGTVEEGEAEGTIPVEDETEDEEEHDTISENITEDKEEPNTFEELKAEDKEEQYTADKVVFSYSGVEMCDEGQCGDNLFWRFYQDGCLEIAGTGDMRDYGRDKNKSPWCEKYQKDINTLILNQGLTSIGEYAFARCECILGELNLPDTVKTIGKSAFLYCKGISGRLVIPDSVTEIGDEAFFSCSGFSGDLLLSANITTIGEKAFSFCSGFSGSILIPDTIITMGMNPFAPMEGITRFEVNKENTHYSVCDGILLSNDNRILIAYPSGKSGTITIPESVVDIGDGAFYWGTGFSGALNIPEGVERIGNFAFYFCSGFKDSLTIPNSVKTIGESAFSECRGFTGPLTLPVELETIGSSAFKHCEGFSGPLTIPKGIRTIGRESFEDCTGFSGNLTIPDGVTSIGDSAFYLCKGFSGMLTIPDSVTEIGERAFYCCKGFTGDLIIPTGVKEIRDSVFCGCEGLRGNLTIPEGVTSIGAGSFSGCTGLTGDLTIPKNVTVIGDNAFSYCSGFSKEIRIPANVSEIGVNPFKGMVRQSEMEVDKENPHYYAQNGMLISKDDGVLVACLAGKKGPLTIPDNVTAIGDSAFYKCSELSGNLIIPNSVTLIGESAFSGCSGFEGKLIVPEKVAQIGSRAFADCSSLDTIILPEGLETLGEDVFSSCYNLRNLVCKNESILSEIPDGVIVTASLEESDKQTYQDIVFPPLEEQLAEEVTLSAEEEELDRSSLKQRIHRLAGGWGNVTSGNFVCHMDDKYATIIQYIGPDQEEINIPDTIEGRIVAGISGRVTYDFGFAVNRGAFWNLVNLRKVNIPDTVVIIENHAFESLDKLETINLPYSLVEIGERAFSGCNALDITELPPLIQEIGDYAFEGTGISGDIVLPEGVEKIGKSSFRGCNNLVSLTLPLSLTEIGKNAFELDNSLSEIFVYDISQVNLKTVFGDSTPCKISLVNEVEIPNDFEPYEIIQSVIPETHKGVYWYIARYEKTRAGAASHVPITVVINGSQYVGEIKSTILYHTAGLIGNLHLLQTDNTSIDDYYIDENQKNQYGSVPTEDANKYFLVSDVGMRELTGARAVKLASEGSGACWTDINNNLYYTGSGDSNNTLISENVTGFAISPNGSIIVYSNSKELVIFDRETRQKNTREERGIVPVAISDEGDIYGYGDITDDVVQDYFVYIPVNGESKQLGYYSTTTLFNRTCTEMVTGFDYYNKGELVGSFEVLDSPGYTTIPCCCGIYNKDTLINTVFCKEYPSSHGITYRKAYLNPGIYSRMGDEYEYISDIDVYNMYEGWSGIEYAPSGDWYIDIIRKDSWGFSKHELRRIDRKTGQQDTIESNVEKAKAGTGGLYYITTRNTLYYKPYFSNEAPKEIAPASFVFIQTLGDICYFSQDGKLMMSKAGGAAEMITEGKVTDMRRDGDSVYCVVFKSEDSRDCIFRLDDLGNAEVLLP